MLELTRLLGHCYWISAIVICRERAADWDPLKKWGGVLRLLGQVRRLESLDGRGTEFCT